MVVGGKDDGVTANISSLSGNEKNKGGREVFPRVLSNLQVSEFW